MSDTKKMKKKKLKKQLLSASATGIILLFNTAGPSASFAYASELDSKERTAQTKNNDPAAKSVAEEAVKALFNGETPNPDNTSEQISEAKAKVDALINDADKTTLLAKIQEAQERLQTKTAVSGLQAARDAVNSLFDEKGVKPDNTQEQIDAAKSIVDSLRTSTTKSMLSAKIRIAQDALNKRNQMKEVQTFVDKLFTGDIPNSKNTQRQIDTAKTKVESLTDSPDKTTLLSKITTAQQAFDERQKSVITSTSPYIEGESQLISGTYTGQEAAYIRVVVNDEKKALVSMKGLPKGTFKYYISSLKATDKVTLQLFDDSYYQLAEETVPVKTTAPIKITHIDPYTEGQTQFITGTFTGEGVAYVRIVVNGEKKTLISTKKLAEGTFKYFADNLKSTDHVSIQLFDASYKQVANVPVTIKKTEAPESVKITSVDPYIEGKSQFVTGTYTGSGAAYMKVIVNGKKEALIPMSGLPEGTFKYYLTGLKKNDQITISLYNKSYKLLVSKDLTITPNVQKQVIQTTPYPANTANAGIMMGQGHDRQDLGIQLKKGAKITVKQTNPNFSGTLTLRLLTNDSHTESSVDFSKNEVVLTAKALAVPFIDTPFNQSNGQKPTIEFSVEGETLKLPKFSKNDDIQAFKKEWNQTKGYALVQGKRFQTFFPEENRIQALNTNLDKVIDLYDNDIIGFYNGLIGLKDNDTNPLNRSSERRYFYKADAHGAGGLYYGGNWAAETSTSASDWLSDGWGILHETGHGYQGSFMNRGMTVGEVWNNIYGVIYTYQHMGKIEADRNSWLYDYGNKAVIENSLKATINSPSANFNKLGLRNKLIILSNIIDKAGNEGLQNFYIKYRELANTPGFKAEKYPLPDLLAANLGTPKKYDFSAVLTAWGLTVSEAAKKQAKENGDIPVAHLAQVVPDNKLNEAITQLTQNNRLSSVLSLVTNQELNALNLKSNITLKFTDENLFDGMKLRILDGDKLYKEITLRQGPVIINDMPNGVYSLELETDTGYIKKPYIFVKDNATINISLNSYLKEADAAVNNLFETNSDTKIKPTIMQKDIDNVKKQVNELPENDQKQKLLKKLDQAFNQLQELTFKGIGDWVFANFDVANSVGTLRTYKGKPHYYISDLYASIAIARDGKNIFTKEYIGTQNNPEQTQTIELKEGDTLTITTREAHRFFTNHPDLKDNNSGTYHYIIQNGKLVVDYLKPVKEVVDNLFQTNHDAKIKPSIMQKDINNAKKKVESLPESPQKQQLLQKLEEAYNQLQEFTFGGLGSWTFATLDIADRIATVRTNSGQPHAYFTDSYASITIKRAGQTIYEKDYIGNKNYPAKTDTIDLQDGDTVTVTHREANDTRLAVNHPDLKNNNSGTYNYTVQNGLLVLNK